MVYYTKSHHVFSLRNDKSGDASRMDPKLENLDVSSSADDIGEYVDRFNFWIDTRETSDDKAIKGSFLTFGRKGSICLTENVGLPLNVEGRFHHRNTRNTSASCKACPVRIRRSCKISYIDPKPQRNGTRVYSLSSTPGI